ncbi:hypothetical protein AZF37_09290 [endosymbiont 'TC1' of Trimyema compressum]|uniref:hypothetical protein n=1 Tax=endosymbiont 'TC1' of Trimyema compressum TaxID=243899 RepID=UPI0007F0D720|nr:hypothetical protein [endosymbiont 'TC1' of Trimyema compressum]AMP21312.1 hypothetical protein AZF37_09290 [endosymbiont 'TC1' of Trimyema compressum]
MQFFNPDGNPCYFQFVFKEKITGEILFESKLVPPNMSLSPIKLNKTMEKGSYPVVLQLHCFDLNDINRELNGAEIEAQLNVL